MPDINDPNPSQAQPIVRLSLCQTGLKCLPIVSVCWEPDGLGHPQTQFVVDDTHDPMRCGDSIVIVPAEFCDQVNAALGSLRDRLTDGASYFDEFSEPSS